MSQVQSPDGRTLAAPRIPVLPPSLAGFLLLLGGAPDLAVAQPTDPQPAEVKESQAQTYEDQVDVVADDVLERFVGTWQLNRSASDKPESMRGGARGSSGFGGPGGGRGGAGGFGGGQRGGFGGAGGTRPQGPPPGGQGGFGGRGGAGRGPRGIEFDRMLIERDAAALIVEREGKDGPVGRPEVLSLDGTAQRVGRSSVTSRIEGDLVVLERTFERNGQPIRRTQRLQVDGDQLVVTSELPQRRGRAAASGRGTFRRVFDRVPEDAPEE